VIFLIGAFLILVSIMIDEGTTLILFMKGYGVLETNPLYVSYGLFAWLTIAILYYFFMLCCWYAVIWLYKRFYEQHAKGYKLYDVFIFLFCILILFFASMKIEAGINNTGMIIDSFNEEKAAEIEANVKYATEVRTANQEYFNTLVLTNYYESILRLSYLQFIIISMGAYLLFRVGYKVMPYEYA